MAERIRTRVVVTNSTMPGLDGAIGLTAGMSRYSGEIMDRHRYALDTTWRMLFKDLGISSANVLRCAGLPDDLLEQSGVCLPAADYYRLWSGIEAEVADPALPVRICQAIRSEAFSPPIFAALCSPNLLVAGRRIARFKEFMAPIRLVITEGDATASVEMVWIDDTETKPPTLVMMELMMSVAVARIGTRELVSPLKAVTTAAIPGVTACEEYLGVRIVQGPKNRLVFDKADVLRPFLTSNDALWQTFEPALRQRLADLEASTSTTARVRAALLEGLPSGQTSVEVIARRLALSKRTLQRRIESEGASYQDILIRLRRDLAHHYLERTSLPTQEISFLLGFEEPNSFYRAFKAWTGSTPEKARLSAR